MCLTQVSLNRALDKLSQMCQFPKFYLSNYFGDLKVRVDKQMATQFMMSPQNTQLLSNWTEIIAKIEMFEKKCVSNSKLVKEQLAHTFERLESIGQANDLKLALSEKFKIQKLLFQNKTIAFITTNEANKTIKSRLLILNDEFVGNEVIRAILTIK